MWKKGRNSSLHFLWHLNTIFILFMHEIFISEFKNKVSTQPCLNIFLYNQLLFVSSLFNTSYISFFICLYFYLPNIYSRKCNTFKIIHQLLFFFKGAAIHVQWCMIIAFHINIPTSTFLSAQNEILWKCLSFIKVEWTFKVIPDPSLASC